ncbi:MAG: rhomboid family intramembrane serine protease [Hyphomicrobiaceae bacterium]|nr:rhomboid family intramembrane serine protease [Hyphomicrobiaceae bacterium]
MFIPIHDDNPLKSIPIQIVTWSLIAANVVVFFLAQPIMQEAALKSFAVVPSELFFAGMTGWAPGGLSELPDAIAIPESLTLLSYMFLHGDAAHLLGNMVFLWVFGDNVEDAMGHLKFLVFYIACGIFAALTHAWFVAGSGMEGYPLIGASGAVAGVIAAYLMLHPRVQVWVLALKVIPLRISAAIVLGLWVLTQVVMVLLPEVGPVAWWAHIGGLIAGAVLIVFMRRPGVPLFDKGLGTSIVGA